MKLAHALYLLTLIGGIALGIAGVYVLAGTGWALIAGGISSWSVAAFLHRGMIGG